MENNDGLLIKVGGSDEPPENYHKLETFADMCRIVNSKNIDNFLQDFEFLLRLSIISTENVDKSELEFSPMYWIDD